MSEALTVTAVVPSYGRPDSLLRCLKGLLAGERAPEEIVVVLRDNDTASLEALERWTANGARVQGSAPTGDPGLKLVLVSESGQVAALNAGLAVATGDVVTFPDDDCVPRPDWLGRLIAHYADPRVGGVGGRDVVHEPTPEPVPAAARAVGRLTWYGRVVGNHHCETPGGPRPVDHLKGVNMSFRRTLLPPFDPCIRGPHYNDTDVSLGLSRHGWKLIYDPEAKVDHYPAPRLDNPGGRDLQDLRLTCLDAHDWMYVVLKHQPWFLRPVSAFYIMLVGSRLRPGLLLGLARALRRPKEAFAALSASLRGALAGMWTWASGGRRCKAR